jgi:CopG family transcriptional regulator/antitoxin EndoAI
MYKRINITLPESTVRLMERLANKGERSRLVDEALKQYLRGATRKSLKKRINEGALRRFERDRALAEAWFRPLPPSHRGVDSSSGGRPERAFRYLTQPDPFHRQAKTCAANWNFKARNNGAS